MVAWIILIAALATILLGGILDLGVFRRTQFVNGPFESETSPPSYCFVVALGQGSRLGRVFATAGDTPSNPFRSRLRLWINGQPAGPAHSIHAEIREHGGGRYSHWGDVVLFSLPTGITNGPSTTAVIEYSPELQAPIYGLGWLALVASAGLLAYRSWRLDPGRLRRKAVISGRLAGALGVILFGAAAVATAIYFATIATGFAQGYALPNTAVFRLLPWTRKLAMYEPATHYLLTFIAMVGAVLSWPAPSAFQKYEAILIRYWNRYGLFAIAALFLFSFGAAWSGIARPADLQSNAIGGLVPLSDAQRHFEMAFDQVITGHWSPFAEQRPFAAAHRTLLMFLAGYSNVRLLLLQAFIVACVAYAATRAVMVWRGLWSGLMFLGLILALVRPYLTTYLTEPLGQFWILLSVPFVIRLLRRGTLVDGAVSFLAVTISLLTRMGSMFTIPAFAIWFAWTQARDTKRFKVTLAIITAVLLGCSLLSATLVRLYGSGTGFLGSNFSFVICGATHGGDWTTCRSLYHDDLEKGGDIFGATQTQYLYAKAWEGFRRRPSVFFHRLVEGEQIFLGNLIPLMLGGYTTPIIPRWFPRTAWTLVVGYGLMITLWRRRERTELSFWLSMWLGLLVSAPLVIFADGWRVLSSVLPLIAVFLACGFATRGVHAPDAVQGSKASKLALAGMLGTISLWIVIPGLAHWLDPLDAKVFRTLAPNPGERFVIGGGHIAGFLVVPDDQPVPTDVPAMRRSEFTKAVEYSGHEAYKKLALPSPSTPFAFILAPNASGTHGRLFVAPPEVLIRRDVPGWRFTPEEEIDEEEDVSFGRVDTATPVARAPN